MEGRKKKKKDPAATDPDKIRRAVVFGALNLLGITVVGSTFGTAIGNLISADQEAKEAYKIVRGAIGQDQSLDQDIIDYINANRMSPNIVTNLPPGANDDSAAVATSLLTLGSGKPISPGNYSSLQRIAHNSANVNSKLLVTDILVSELVRGGASSEANRIFHSAVTPEDVAGDDANMLIYINQAYSLAYTSISPNSAIDPTAWGFSRALSMASTVDFSRYGFKIVGDKVELATVPMLDSRAWSWNVKGFYSLNWTL